MGRVTEKCRVVRIDVRAGDAPVVAAAGVRRHHRPDTLAVEEPLEIRIGGRPLAVTMRTPGNDFDLVAGFLVGEGIAAAADDIRAMRHCGSGPPPLRAAASASGATPPGGLSAQPIPAGEAADDLPPGDVVDVALRADAVLPESALTRAFPVTSACGVCGKARIADILARGRWPVADDPLRVAADRLAALPGALRAAQRVFERTGGLHAAGLFDAAGRLRCLREDVGRHNAVDKVIGWALRAGELPLRGHVLLVSGRASFELTQKAVCAGIPLLAAVSAPSSLAVDLARGCGLTLVGFLRGATMNVYTAGERITDG